MIDAHVLLGTQHGNIRVLYADTGDVEFTLVGHSQRICCMQTCVDNTFVSGSADGTVRVWCARTFKCVRLFDEHTGAVVCVAVHAHMYVTHSDRMRHSTGWSLAAPILQHAYGTRTVVIVCEHADELFITTHLNME